VSAESLAVVTHAAQVPRDSIIIPAYRGDSRLIELAKRVLADPYPAKELVIVLDEPLASVAQQLAELQGCKLLISPVRMGKVRALNRALKESKGDILILLDDDVLIEDEGFISKIANSMKRYDLADIKKVIVGDSLLAKLVYIEYVAVNFASKLMAKYAGRTLAINGAAFAIKREVLEKLGGFPATLTEDFDLGLKCFISGCSFTYIEETHVLNFPPDSWGEWLKQRKRWAVGVADWLRRNFHAILTAVVAAPHIIIPSLLLLVPSIATFALTLALYNFSVYKALLLALLLLASAVSQVIPVATALTVNVQLLYLVTTTPLLVALAVFALWHAAASRSLGLRSRVLYYPLYLFVYQTLWLVILLAGFFRVIVFRKTSVDDWVV